MSMKCIDNCEAVGMYNVDLKEPGGNYIGICRNGEYYIDPTSNSAIELGTF